jgi:hypothetical protein
MPRKRWFIGLAVLLAATSAGVHFWRVPRPPAPPAARLPASARVLLAPFHKESFDVTVEAHQDLDYRVGMQAGATLVYTRSKGQPRHGRARCFRSPILRLVPLALEE